MKIHQIKRSHKNKKSVQVGRGGKRGKTSGRGTKGQKARAGRKIRPEMRDVIKRLPKKRGYRFKSIQPKPVIISITMIEKNYSDSEEISPKTLLEKKLISLRDFQKKRVKILSGGSLSKKISVSGCLVSRSAIEQIQKAGGTIK